MLYIRSQDGERITEAGHLYTEERFSQAGNLIHCYIFRNGVECAGYKTKEDCLVVLDNIEVAIRLDANREHSIYVMPTQEELDVWCSRITSDSILTRIHKYNVGPMKAEPVGLKKSMKTADVGSPHFEDS